MEAPVTLPAAAVRELDRRAIGERGVPSELLMENAGRACAAAALAMGAAGGTVAVLAGPGNNGGDGLVVARTLRNHGLDVRTFSLGRPGGLSERSGDLALMARLLESCGGEIESLVEGSGLADLGDLLAGGDVSLVVDALFGTGLARPLGGLAAEVVGLVNSSGRPVLAVDLPSGLDADSGAELGATVRATRTVTFVAAKPGLFLGVGPERAGAVEVAEIGIPRDLVLEVLATAGGGAEGA